MRLYPTIKLKTRGVTTFTLRSDGVRDGYLVSIIGSNGMTWSGTVQELNPHASRIRVVASALEFADKELTTGDVIDIDITVSNADGSNTETISLFAELEP